MKLIKKIFIVYILLMSFGRATAQVCQCDSMEYIPTSKDYFESVYEMVQIRPDCDSQPALYVQLKKRIMRSPHHTRIITYPCRCADKAKMTTEEIREPAEYVNLQIWDCAGNITIQQHIVKVSQLRLVQRNVAPPIR